MPCRRLPFRDLQQRYARQHSVDQNAPESTGRLPCSTMDLLASPVGRQRIRDSRPHIVRRRGFGHGLERLPQHLIE
jgi:hypothetical protein